MDAVVNWTSAVKAAVLLSWSNPFHAVSSSAAAGPSCVSTCFLLL